MTNTADSTKWPDIIDVLVTLGERGLYVFYVQSPDEEALRDGELVARTERAALMEVTAWLGRQGFEPTSRWEREVNDGGDADILRRFMRGFGLR